MVKIIFQKVQKEEVSIVAQQLTNLTSIHEDMGSIPDLTQCCPELWCRSQTRLEIGIAVAVV